MPEPAAGAAEGNQARAIAVCVTTRNRAHLLPRLFAALEAQTLGSESFEVIVTDDGSDDTTAEVLSTLAQHSSFPVAVMHHRRSRGPAEGRNRAWLSTAAPLVAFIDDDCVPVPTWLAAHVDALGRADISQGRVESDPEQRHHFGAFSRAVTVLDENGLYETCNIAYRRTWLERLGGFDPGFAHSGEDTDLGWRAKAAGASTTFIPEALVFHDVNPSSWRRALHDARRWKGVVQLVDRHPHLRTRFGSGLVWRPAHGLAAVAWAGIGLLTWGLWTGRRVLGAAGLLVVVPYARHRLVTTPLSGSRRERVLTLPAALVLDSWELVVVSATRVRVRRQGRQAVQG